MKSLVLTVVSEDKPGVVESLAQILADHQALWECSRMARMTGRFAGILQVSVPGSYLESLRDALDGWNGGTVVAEEAEAATAADGKLVRLEVVANDEPGLVQRLAGMLAGIGVNVEEMSSEVVAAPMAGGHLFRMKAEVLVPATVSKDRLRDVIEAAGDDFMVEMMTLRR